jgi:hypothetical protein
MHAWINLGFGLAYFPPRNIGVEESKGVISRLGMALHIF